MVHRQRTAVAYLRVSTDEQHLGPEAQRASIEAWAAREGVSVVAWHVDAGVSGAAPLDKRPALLAALDDVKTHRASTLVVAKRDRLARDVMAAAMIERLASKLRATVATADGVGAGDSPEAAMMRQMLDVFAQFERSQIAARTKAALAAKRARGEKTGGSLPFGHIVADDGRTLAANADEQHAIARVHALAAEGLSQRAIADALNSEGIAARGARWHRTTVARLLTRAA